MIIATKKARPIDVYSIEGICALLRSWQLIAFAALKQYSLPLRRAVRQIPITPFANLNCQGKQWIEIPLYGFLSRNYIEFSSEKLSSVKRSFLPDGSLVIEFADGSVIIEAISGHVVELDGRSRVILVRVLKEEASGAMRLLHKSDLGEAFRVKNTGENEHLICLPGNILVRENSTHVRVQMPNGVEMKTRKRSCCHKTRNRKS